MLSTVGINLNEARKTVERMGMTYDELRANQYFNDGIEFNHRD